MGGKHLSLLVHFIWSTAGREPWIGSDWQDDLFGIVGGIINKKNARLLCAGGMFDHVHLYASLPSTISIADLVNGVKSNSSRWVHESSSTRKGFAWHEGYGAFSVSIMPSEVSRMSLSSSWSRTSSNTTRNICGIDSTRISKQTSREAPPCNSPDRQVGVTDFQKSNEARRADTNHAGPSDLVNPVATARGSDPHHDLTVAAIS
jgi:REP element-mobilizing transposase RayT